MGASNPDASDMSDMSEVGQVGQEEYIRLDKICQSAGLTNQTWDGVNWAYGNVALLVMGWTIDDEGVARIQGVGYSGKITRPRLRLESAEQGWMGPDGVFAEVATLTLESHGSLPGIVNEVQTIPLNMRRGVENEANGLAWLQCLKSHLYKRSTIDPLVRGLLRANGGRANVLPAEERERLIIDWALPCDEGAPHDLSIMTGRDQWRGYLFKQGLGAWSVIGSCRDATIRFTPEGVLTVESFRTSLAATGGVGRMTLNDVGVDGVMFTVQRVITAVIEGTNLAVIDELNDSDMWYDAYAESWKQRHGRTWVTVWWET